MALSYAHGAIQWLAADAATTVYTVSGLSFQPKAIRFFMQGLGSATDTSSTTTHERSSVGFTTGTSARQCVGIQDQDATGSATCTSGYRDDCIAMTMTQAAAVIDGRLDLNSITSDGFTCIVDDQAPVNLTVFWEAWGGTDISVQAVGSFTEPASTGNVDYTVTGFVSASNDDQIVMFAGTQVTGASPTVAIADSGICVGYAGGNGLGNAVIASNSDDGSATMDTDGYALDGECIAMITLAGGNPSARATLTQFGTDNFRLNWIARATTGRRYIYLAIKGGQWKVGGSTIDATTNNATSTVSGLAFAPVGLSVISASNTESSAGTASDFGLLFWGCGSSTTSRRAMSCTTNHGTGNAEIRLFIEYDQVLTGDNTLKIDISQMNSDGFQLIVDANDASEPATAWYGYMTFGSEGPSDETLSAGTNTITITAPTAVTSSGAVTIAAGANTVTITAPTANGLVENLLAGGANTITLTVSDATVTVGAVSIAGGATTVTTTAPTAVALAEISLAGGANTTTISSPDATLVAATSLEAGTTTVTATAPTAVLSPGNSNIAAGAVTITFSVDDADITVEGGEAILGAGTNTIVLTAPTANLAYDQFLSGGTITFTITCPAAALSAGGVSVSAGANTVTLSAPAAGIDDGTDPTPDNALSGISGAHSLAVIAHRRRRMKL